MAFSCLPQTCRLKAAVLALGSQSPFLFHPVPGSPVVMGFSWSWFRKEVLVWTTPALGNADVWVEHAVHNLLPKGVFLAFLRAVSQGPVQECVRSSKTWGELKEL